jgi:hypothetical protein
MRIRLERAQKPQPQTVRSRITNIRNHLLFAEMQLQALKGRDEFFQTRYEQVQALRFEFDAFPIWYGLQDPA